MVEEIVSVPDSTLILLFIVATARLWIRVLLPIREKKNEYSSILAVNEFSFLLALQKIPSDNFRNEAAGKPLEEALRKCLEYKSCL